MHADHLMLNRAAQAGARRAGRHAPREPEPARRSPRRRRRRDRARRRPHRRVSHAGPHARLGVLRIEGAVLTGDTLMIGGSGRTDFPGRRRGRAVRRRDRPPLHAARRDRRVARPRLQGQHLVHDRRREAQKPALRRQDARRVRRLDGQPRSALSREGAAVAAGQPVGLRGLRGRLPAGVRSRRARSPRRPRGCHASSAALRRRSCSTCASRRSSSASSATSRARCSFRSTRSSAACRSSRATSIATWSSYVAPAHAARAPAPSCAARAFSACINLEGGMLAWDEAGLPVQR